MKLYKKLFLLFLILGIHAGINAQSLYEWSALGSQANGYGVYGTVNAIVIFKNVIAGGAFTMAGNTPVNNIASYNGSSWTALGQGVNGFVYALAVYNNELYAAGIFSTLYIFVPGQPEYELVPVKENDFKIKQLDGFEAKFNVDADGKVTELISVQPNGSFVCKKK